MFRIRLSFVSAALLASFMPAGEPPSARSARESPPVVAPALPLKIGPTGRYLVDQNDVPFLIAGESPQAMMVNASEPDAELFLRNRRSHGFNTAWVNLICAKYTGGRDDGSTIDGIKPFAGDFDFSQPEERYFARCDRILKLAAKHNVLVMLDPAETGSFLAVLKKNGVDKCRAYGRYLGRRYARYDNLLWFHGNDYIDDTPENDRLVLAVLEGIKEFDDRHLHTVELDWKRTGRTSLDNDRWAAAVGLARPTRTSPSIRSSSRTTTGRPIGGCRHSWWSRATSSSTSTGPSLARRGSCGCRNIRPSSAVRRASCTATSSPGRS